MNKTKEMYGMDRYKEYETRSVKPQECALEKVPTIMIAGWDVTMQDMFDRPEYVNKLKELQLIIDEVMSQIKDLRRKGLNPTAILVDRKTENSLRHAPNGVYVPCHMSQANDADTFMGLVIAAVTGRRDTQYIRVVV